MAIDTAKITSLLGDQIKFVPTKTNSVHSLSMKDGNFNILSPEHASIIMRSREDYQNAKIPAASAPDGYLWIILDYDDKKLTNIVPDLATPFNLKPTYTVKTPTGAGRQEWYKISEQDAAKLPKNKYIIPSFPNVEIFIGRRSGKQLFFVAPGSKKDNGEYVLSNAIECSLISTKFIETLQIQVQAENDFLDKNLEPKLHNFSVEIDSTSNISEFASIIDKISSAISFGGESHVAEGGRNQFIYDKACIGFEYNLSSQKVSLILTKMNNIVFEEPLEEFEIDTSIQSAYNNIREARKRLERALGTTLKLFEFDDYGHRKVTKDELEAKVVQLSKHRLYARLESEELRTLLCETIIQDISTGVYYVSTMVSPDLYNKEYGKSLINELKDPDSQIEYQRLLDLKSQSILHWEMKTSKQMNEKFQFFRGNSNKNLIASREFKRHSFECYVTETRGDPILNDDRFFHHTESPIGVAQDVTKEEKQKVSSLLRRQCRYILDPNNFEKEFNYVLDRYALMLQNPNKKIDNIMVLQGSQGSGKTKLVETFMYMFPVGDVQKVANAELISGRFEKHARVLHIDEIEINNNKDIHNVLKSISTSETQSQEVKYQERKTVTQAVNLSMSTNEDIHDMEILNGRRFTVIVNDEVFLIEDVRRETREILIEYKKNNWRLLEVMHTMLIERDASGFKPDFVTDRQRLAIMEMRKGTDFDKSLLISIMNYGYVSPELCIQVAGENVNRHDLILSFRHYLKLEVSDKYKFNVNMLKISTNENNRMDSFINDKHKKSLYKQLYPDAKSSIKSKFGSTIGFTWSNVVPSMKERIKLLTYCYIGRIDIESIQYIVDEFKLKKQWNWDEKTKPDVDNLGSINYISDLDFIRTGDNEDDY